VSARTSTSTSGTSTSGRHRRHWLAPPLRPRASWIGWFVTLAVAGLLAAMIAPRPGGIWDSANVSGPCPGARTTAPRTTAPRTTAPGTPAAGASAAKACPSARARSVPPRRRRPAHGTRPLRTPGNVSCDIIVPARPLTARGLATPYRLTGPHGLTPGRSKCTMANAANLGAFVQATILNPATGALRVYEPLVITEGTRPAVAPVVPKLPARAVVTIDFGFNGTNLTQVGATRNALRQGRCVNGLRHSIFSQVSFCNGTRFFAAAFRAEGAGRLVVPRIGVSPKTRHACLTTRSFDVVDQDPSDNVTTTYLLTRGGRTAQFNGSNRARLPRAEKVGNGSDNALLDTFLDPALGCTPFKAPDLSRGGRPGTSQALDELAAARYQRQPVALVPQNDPMVMARGKFSAKKTNLYRLNVGQDTISAANNAASSPPKFCQNMVNIQTRFLKKYRALLKPGPTPVPSVGDNLLTFMANRLSMSYVNLRCHNYGLFNPVKVTLNRAGVAVGATFDTTRQQAG
jgi:hypothetical protein